MDSVVGVDFSLVKPPPAPSYLMRRAADILHVMIGIRLSKDDLCIALPCVEHTVNKELDV